MPGLIAFGRRWSIGSDDAILPASLLALTSLIWICVLGGLAPEFISDARAEGAPKKFWFLALAHLIITCLCLIVEILLCVCSLRGRIMYPPPRWPVTYLIYARLILFVTQLASAGLAIGWIRTHGLRVPSAKTLTGLVIWELLLLVILILCAWDEAGKQWVKWQKTKQDENDQSLEEAYEKSWENRCKILCCCIGFKQEYKESFRSVAKVFSSIFEGDDVVPTDIIAGMMLVREKQHKDQEDQIAAGEAIEFRSGAPITQRTRFLDPHDAETRARISDMRHFQFYAWGSYGWPHFLISNGLPGYIRWLKGLDWCFCTPETIPNAVVDGADFCMCNYSAFQSTLSSRAEGVEIVYLTYKGRVGETPFLVAVDHNKEAIVIVCRGTRSLEDAITDVLITPILIPLRDGPDDFLGHQGCTNSATYIYNRLINEKLIERARERQKSGKEYRIIVVGHSLGAGTAPLLAMLLRQDYPQLKCYAFSPPGSLVSLSAAEYCKSFITTVVIGEDLIPRVGMPQLSKFRAEIMNELAKTPKSKWTVICNNACGCCARKQSDPEKTFTDISSASEGTATASQKLNLEPDNLEVKVHDYMKQAAVKDQPTIHLYLPGNIIHFVRGETPSDLSAYWCENTSFQEILVSSEMVNDHRGDTVLSVMGKYIDEE